MEDAVIANWGGYDYQTRFFWINASGLRDPEKPHVVEVSYEAGGPKGFDNVVVRYSSGMAGADPSESRQLTTRSNSTSTKRGVSDTPILSNRNPSVRRDFRFSSD